MVCPNQWQTLSLDYWELFQHHDADPSVALLLSEDIINTQPMVLIKLKSVKLFAIKMWSKATAHLNNDNYTPIRFYFVHHFKSTRRPLWAALGGLATQPSQL